MSEKGCPIFEKKRDNQAIIPLSGEGGIRTLDTLLKYTHFPGVLFRPLRHLSGNWIANVELLIEYRTPNAELRISKLITSSFDIRSSAFGVRYYLKQKSAPVNRHHRRRRHRDLVPLIPAKYLFVLPELL